MTLTLNAWRDRDRKSWMGTLVASLVIIAPWLIALAFSADFLVLNALVAGLMAASMIGVVALVVLGITLFRNGS